MLSMVLKRVTLTGLLVLTLVGLAARGSARAQGLDARALSNRAVDYFRRGQYEQALADFEASYALNPIPEMLFNIGQTYRLRGDCSRALQSYRRYLEISPTGRLRDKAAARIAELQNCGAPDPPSESPAPGHEVTVPTPPPSPTLDGAASPSGQTPKEMPRPLSPAIPASLPPGRSWVAPQPNPLRRRSTIAGLTGLGAALGLAAVGIDFAVETSAKATEVSRLSRMGGVWAGQAPGLESAGRRDQIIAGAMFGSAAALALASSALLILGQRSSHAPLHAAVAATSGQIECDIQF
jgi:tetratricopeptide (TPR) repeat protein